MLIHQGIKRPILILTQALVYIHIIKILDNIVFSESLNSPNLCHKLVTEAFGHVTTVHFSVELGASSSL